MSDMIFSRRGLTLEGFYRNQRTLHESTILELNNEMDEYDLGLDLIVVGVNRGTDAHIYQVFNPGVALPQDSLAFACIGTGQRHADVVFAYRKYTPSFSLEKAIYVVLEAKKKAEMAGGVGASTDIVIIRDDATYKLLPQTIITELEKIYSDTEKKSKIDKEIDEALEKLSIRKVLDSANGKLSV
jgi:20S proteasome alpha/beta subunit